MRILIDPSSYHCLNLGDVAMMQVAVRRFQGFWPGAEIHIFTSRPDLIQFYCPGAIPVDHSGRQAYFSEAAVLNRLAHRHSDALSVALSEMEVEWRQRNPAALSVLLRSARKRKNRTGADIFEFKNLVESCQLVAASGAGQVTDAFKGPGIMLLNTLEMAVRADVPAVMVGHGIGPISDPQLRKRAAKVLPRLDYIGLREALVGPALVRSLGVSDDRALLTGDDAIELAYENRNPSSLGEAIGLNLRVAEYAQIGQDSIGVLRSVLQDIARELDAPVASVPISRHPEERDQEICDQLTEGYPKVFAPLPEIERTEVMMRQISRCRVVVTTSYHGGVFTLSQGIPVVAWVKSRYFAAKLNGLANQFGVGCEVVVLEEGGSRERLQDAIRNAWWSAEQVRTPLLNRAEEQIRLSKAGYRRVYDTVARKVPGDVTAGV